MFRTLFADFWKSSFLSFGLSGRGKLLEKEWSLGLNGQNMNFKALNSNELDSSLFFGSYLNYWYSQEGKMDYSLPLFIANTTHVESGAHSYFLPIDLGENLKGNSIDVLDTMDHYQNSDNSCGLRMSTAVRMSASFPIINPAVMIKDVGHFVDGGYYDNRGSKLPFSIFHQIRKWQKDHSSLTSTLKLPDSTGQVLFELLNKLEPSLIVLLNDSGENFYQQLESKKGKIKPINQGIAPVNALAKVRSGHTRHLQESLVSSFENEGLNVFQIKLVHGEYINCCKEKGKNKTSNCKEIRPNLPLARLISPCARQGIRENLGYDSNKGSLDRIIEELGK